MICDDCHEPETGEKSYACPARGWQMTPHFCRLYQIRPEYRARWEETGGPGVAVPSSSPPEIAPLAERLAEETGDPSIVGKAGRYAKALARWSQAGFPTRTDEQVKEIYTKHCLVCEKFNQEARACQLCGCKVGVAGWAVTNKIKMGTENCPIDKW